MGLQVRGNLVQGIGARELGFIGLHSQRQSLVAGSIASSKEISAKAKA